jgi:hypothetical protein
MKRLISLLALLVVGTGSHAIVITQWNFNGPSAGEVPGGPNSPTPSTGAGIASLLSGVTASFSSGIVNGGSSDLEITSPPNFGWQTTNYAAQGASSGTAGVQFMVSTLGMTDIAVRFDTRHSNTSSRWVRFDYTIDGGTNWVLGSATDGTIYEGTSGDTWFNLRGADLTAAPGVANNANFGFRMVTVFGPAQGPFVDGFNYTSYSASNATSSYAASGTLRWDMVTVTGNPVPEPATVAALAMGVGALVRSRRRGR